MKNKKKGQKRDQAKIESLKRQIREQARQEFMDHLRSPKLLTLEAELFRLTSQEPAYTLTVSYTERDPKKSRKILSLNTYDVKLLTGLKIALT